MGLSIQKTQPLPGPSLFLLFFILNQSQAEAETKEATLEYGLVLVPACRTRENAG